MAAMCHSIQEEGRTVRPEVEEMEELSYEGHETQDTLLFVLRPFKSTGFSWAQRSNPGQAWSAISHYACALGGDTRTETGPSHTFRGTDWGGQKPHTHYLGDSAQRPHKGGAITQFTSVWEASTLPMKTLLSGDEKEPPSWGRGGPSQIHLLQKPRFFDILGCCCFFFKVGLFFILSSRSQCVFI